MQVLKDKVKKRITDAALNEFLKNGYKNVSMKEIAQKAGIANGNIYAHFLSKEALLEYLVNNAIVTLREIISEKILWRTPSLRSMLMNMPVK